MAPLTKHVLLLAFVCCYVIYAQAQTTGGLAHERPADDAVRSVIASVQPELASKYPAEFTKVEPIIYRTQVVAGMNFFVKALVTEKSGKQSHVHLRIYRPLSGPAELTALRTDVHEKTPLRYFQ